eukprot:gene2480-20707_t
MPPQHFGRMGIYRNDFLGLRWLKRFKMPYAYGYPYSWSQHRTINFTFWPRSALKDLAIWAPAGGMFLWAALNPSYEGMLHYGFWRAATAAAARGGSGPAPPAHPDPHRPGPALLPDPV